MIKNMDYSNLTNAELKSLCKKRSITNYSKCNKASLIALLENTDNKINLIPDKLEKSEVVKLTTKVVDEYALTKFWKQDEKRCLFLNMRSMLT